MKMLFLGLWLLCHVKQATQPVHVQMAEACDMEPKAAEESDENVEPDLIGRPHVVLEIGALGISSLPCTSSAPFDTRLRGVPWRVFMVRGPLILGL